MIKLYGFGQQFGIYDASPFVLKIHTYLRIANIKYKSIADLQNIRKAPKAKLPFIEDEDTLICDSQHIITHLNKKYNINLDKDLTPQQQSQSYLMTKSLDENLYWCLYWSRWQHEDTWKIVKKAYFSSLPFPLSVLVPPLLRKKAIKAIYAQGMGRHTQQEIIDIADATFKALSMLLGDQDYFFGQKISLFDATAYAFLASFNQVSIENQFNSTAKKYTNLTAYTTRISDKYFTS